MMPKERTLGAGCESKEWHCDSLLNEEFLNYGSDWICLHEVAIRNIRKLRNVTERWTDRRWTSSQLKITEAGYSHPVTMSTHENFLMRKESGSHA
jgi:hypothetical protein